MNNEKTELDQDTISQIELHKYLLSEKAGYDVGWEFAEQDWRLNQMDQTNDNSVESEQDATVRPRGWGGIIKRLLSKAAV